MLLSLLLLIPFLGALVLILWPGSLSSARLRDVSIVVLVVQCLVSFALLLPFDAADAGLQLVEQARWVHAIGLDYALALDGLSLPLVLMNGVARFSLASADSLKLSVSGQSQSYVLTVLLAIVLFLTAVSWFLT